MLEPHTMLKYLLYILLFCSFCACSPSHQDTDAKQFNYQTDSLHYAQHFSIQHANNHTLLTIHNPWHQGEILGKYYLVKHDSVSTPSDGIKLIVPLQNICIQSAPHIGYIDALQQANTVIGTCSPQLFYSPNITTQYKKGKIAHLGDAYQMNIEKIVLLSPQAIFTTAYPQADKQSERLQKLGIPVIPTVEWTEPNLLARAEWIKVWGVLFNKSATADSIFASTTQAYNHWKQLAQTASHQPSILSGQPYNNIWYMPGGKSYMGQLFKDANTSYYFQDTTEEGSLPVSIETAWYYFHQASIWVGIDAHSTDQLLQLENRLQNFKAVKDNQLFHYNKRITPQGGNDFWESAVVYPDRLLHDLIRVTHPELLPESNTYYIAPLP